VTLLYLCKHSAIPLFDPVLDHSFVPTEVSTADARSGGPGRPPGRRASALPWTGASAAACSPAVGIAAGVLLIVLSSALTLIDAVQAETVSIGHPASVLPADPVAAFVAEASQRFRLPVPWIRAIIRVESAGDVRALSRKGAMGLMQIMPATWVELRLRYGLGADPYDPHDNILAGAAYISELRDRYGVPGFLAAYNAGPNRYEDYLTTGRDLPAETRAYVAMLLLIIAGGQIDGRTIAAADTFAWERAPLFIVRAESKSTDVWSPPKSQPDSSPSAYPGTHLSALMPQSGGLFVRLVGEVGWQ
jgi:hypothetical protein